MELLLPRYALALWVLFILVAFGLFLFVLVDILRHQFNGSNTKLIWVLVVIVLPFVGSMLYLLIGRSQKINLL